jgi:ParB/RepB/Spo0J family partition protein
MARQIEGATRTNLFLISPADIAVDPGLNTRRQEPSRERVEELGRDMNERGNRTPVECRPIDGGRVQLVAGYTRHRAALWVVESGLNPDFKLRVLVFACSEEEAPDHNVAEDTMRHELSPMDRANIVRRYRDVLGKDDRFIAERLRCAPSYVGQLAKLLTIPRHVQRKVHEGAIPARTAMAPADLPAEERDAPVREAEESAGRVAHARVAARLRDRAAATCRGKRIGRTAGEVRGFFEGLAGPGEDPDVASFADALVGYVRGTTTDEQMQEAVLRLVEGEASEVGRVGVA